MAALRDCFQKAIKPLGILYVIATIFNFLGACLAWAEFSNYNMEGAIIYITLLAVFLGVIAICMQFFDLFARFHPLFICFLVANIGSLTPLTTQTWNSSLEAGLSLQLTAMYIFLISPFVFGNGFEGGSFIGNNVSFSANFGNNAGGANAGQHADGTGAGGNYNNFNDNINYNNTPQAPPPVAYQNQYQNQPYQTGTM